MAEDLAGIYPTILDLICIYAIVFFNIFILQNGVHTFNHVLNIFLIIKDVTVIVAWANEDMGADYHFHAGIWHWGYLLLRRPLGLPIILALLNLFVLRINYYRILLGGSEEAIPGSTRKNKVVLGDGINAHGLSRSISTV
jgi:hypothetical protein